MSWTMGVVRHAPAQCGDSSEKGPAEKVVQHQDRPEILVFAHSSNQGEQEVERGQ